MDLGDDVGAPAGWCALGRGSLTADTIRLSLLHAQSGDTPLEGQHDHHRLDGLMTAYLVRIKQA
jgi:hypothetical protein